MLNLSFLLIYFFLNFFSTSTKGIKKLSKEERASFSLNDYLNQALIGLLLGNGHIQRRSLTANSRLLYSQSIKHEKYFNSVYSLFKPFCTTFFTSFTKSHINKETNVINKSLSFVTMALPCFNIYRDLFYSTEGVKIIPQNIGELLTPVGLAF